MFNACKHAVAAARFAEIALGDNPEQIYDIDGGWLAMTKEAAESNAGDAFVALLREAVQAQRPELTVVLVSPWMTVEGYTGDDGFQVAICPLEHVVNNTLSAPVAGIRLFRFMTSSLTPGGRGNNCRMSLAASAYEWERRSESIEAQRLQREFEAPLLKHHRLLLAACYAVLSSCHDQLSGSQHIAAWLEELRKCIERDIDGSLMRLLDTTNGMAEASRLVSLIALGLKLKPSHIYAEAERRVGEPVD